MKGRPNWETELLKCFERYNKKKGKWNKDIRSGYNHMGRLPSLPPPDPRIQGSNKDNILAKFSLF